MPVVTHTHTHTQNKTNKINEQNGKKKEWQTTIQNTNNATASTLTEIFT
jgi:hypothetical protein